MRGRGVSEWIVAGWIGRVNLLLEFKCDTHVLEAGRGSIGGEKEHVLQSCPVSLLGTKCLASLSDEWYPVNLEYSLYGKLIQCARSLAVSIRSEGLWRKNELVYFVCIIFVI